MPRPRTRSTHWLLAWLVLQHPRDVDRGSLAEMMWPDSSPDIALQTLRRTVCDLRKILDAQAWRLMSPNRHTLRLDLTGASVDVLDFDAALVRADAASLEHAVELCQGSFLEGCDQEWAVGERTTREEAYLAARENLADYASARGDHATAIHHLRHAIAVDPLRESAQRALMAALAASGNYAAAIQVYRDLRILLHRELNVPPAPETIALFQEIRSQSLRRTPPNGASPNRSPKQSSGWPGGGKQKSGTGAQCAPAHIPRPLTSLVGREQTLAEIAQCLGSARLVTLTGPGGVGKTRLALQAAQTAARNYADGASFVDLAPLTDGAFVPQTVADALGVPAAPDAPLTSTLVDFLQPKQLLLVLDNCEHVLGEVAALVEALLEEAGSTTVLATSRKPLRLPGEQEFPVPCLSTPASSDAPDQLLCRESVQLFVDRARSVRPDFQLTPGNARAVAELCAGLEGLPLALELAATRARVLSPGEMLARLERPLELLAGRRRTDPRHRSLRAALDWSYRLLSPELRRFFARLSAFHGGWTLEAAAEVCEEPSTLDPLDELVECSLVLVEEEAEETRYRMLKTVREYAAEQLAPQEPAELSRRHATYYLGLAARAKPGLQGTEQQPWLDRLEREYPNLRATLEWLVRNEQVDEGLQLVGALADFWYTRGCHKEVYTLLRKVLALPDAVGRTPARARVLGLLPGNRSVPTRELREESLAIFRELGDPRGTAVALRSLGCAAVEQGSYAYARACFEESLAIFHELGDLEGTAASLHLLGLVAQEQGDYTAARSLLEESLAIRQKLGNKLTIASTLHKLGQVAEEQSDYATARALQEECLEIRRALADQPGIGYALHGLGLVALAQGEFARAEAYFQESLSIRRNLDDGSGIALSLWALGLTAHEQGDDPAARRFFEESLEARRELGDQRGIALSLWGLASVAQSRGDFETARGLHEESLAIRRDLGDQRGVAGSLHALAELAQAGESYGRARALFTESLAIRQRIGHKRGLAESFEGLGGLAAGQGQAGRAALLVGAADALRETMEAPLPPASRAGYDRCVAASRTALGEAAYSNAWAQGRAMTVADAVLEATRAS